MANRWGIMWIFALVLGLNGSLAPAATEPGAKAQIEALEAKFAAGFKAKDLSKIMSCYARDGLFVFDVTPPRQHVGWEDYKKDWESLFGGMAGSPTLKIDALDVTVVGPVGYSHSIQSARWTATGGSTVEVTVRVTDVYRKLAGEWRIVQEHVSVPVDFASGKGDLLSKP